MAYCKAMGSPKQTSMGQMTFFLDDKANQWLTALGEETQNNCESFKEQFLPRFCTTA